MRHRHAFAASLAVALASLGGRALAQDLPSGYGVLTPSGSTFTTSISPAGDVDEYAFQGFPGMKLTAVVTPVKPAKGSAVPALVPTLSFVRPDGTVADDDAGFVGTFKGAALVGTMVLDAPGWWQVRVGGKNLAAHAVPPAVNPPLYSTGGYTVNVVYKAASAQPTLPVLGKSFSKNAAIAAKASTDDSFPQAYPDTDDYFFDAYSGQTISVTVKPAKKSLLVPGLQLFKPDGTQVTGAGVVAFNGKQASAAAVPAPTEAGAWRVRVYGVDTSAQPDPKHPLNTTGAYSVAVKLGKAPVTPSLVPDGNKQYVFTIPAVGGATVSYALAFKGAAPTFNSFVDPTGKDVPGFNGDGVVKLAPYVVPAGLPVGNYTLTYDAPGKPWPTAVTFSSKVVPPDALGKAVKVALSAVEPTILTGGVTPASGGSTSPTILSVSTNGNLVDPSVPDPSLVKLYVDHVALTGIATVGSSVRGTVPAGLPLGIHDVVVQTSSGQVAVAQGAFEVVPPPLALSIDPVVGSIAGGYPMKISGQGFSKLADPQIVIGDLQTVVPAHITSVTDTEIDFVAPSYGAAGKSTFGVVDNTNGNGALLPLNSFEFVTSPAISRLVPNLTTILGGDLINVTGANFAASDHVYLERTSGSNVYDEISTTFVDATNHQFTAPARPKGAYNVYVTDQFGQPLPPRTRALTYFQFADLSATTSGLFPPGADLWDGSSVAVADFDKDGYDDIFVSRVGAATTADASPDTRVLHNDGHGRFLDVTADVMPAATASEDWRADRIWVTDVNQDGWPDIVIVTNDSTVLSSSASHVRILRNEPLDGSPNSPRVFRDRTSSLMPGPRTSSNGAVADNWRGLDMWVGDVDKGPAGPPEILITHKELKQELDVSCVPYCSSPFASGYTYGFYWGGSRAFFWDKNANGGQGKYKFERNFFPRKSGLRVPVTTPTGVVIPICNGQNYGKPCIGQFTPFLGKRIAVADLDGDGKPDVAVLSDAAVQRIFPPATGFVTISSLQVAINKTNFADGAEVTDVTDKLTALGGDFKGDAVEIASIGYPDGNAYGTIADAKASPGGAGLAMRLVKFKPASIAGQVADFDDITTSALPTSGGADVWQASKILFRDIDNDGDQDMILVCPSPPGGTGPAFRILRNDIVNQQAGIFTTQLMPLLQGTYLPLTANEHYEADAMAVGDFNKDGALDFVLVRASTTAPSPETRIIITANK